MNIKEFLKIYFVVTLFLIVINLIGNATYEYLDSNGMIISQTADGFTTWEVVLDKSRPVEVLPLNSKFISLPLEYDEIKKFKHVIVLMGSSVVQGAGVAMEDKFSSLLNEKYNKDGIFFFNAGIQGTDFYTYSREVLDHVIQELSNVKCVIWFPNRNDLVPLSKTSEIEDAKEEAKSLSDAKRMPIKDKILFGFYKKIGQRLRFHVNTLKAKFINNPSNIYYTQGLVDAMSETTAQSLDAEIGHLSQELNSKNVTLSSVFLPSRHFNRFHNWKDAKSFLKLEEILRLKNTVSTNLFNKFKNEDPYIDQVHFNEMGHSTIAHSLEDELSQLCPEIL